MNEIFSDKRIITSLVVVEVSAKYINRVYDGSMLKYIDKEWDYMESIEYKDGYLVYDDSIDQLYFIRLIYSA